MSQSSQDEKSAQGRADSERSTQGPASSERSAPGRASSERSAQGRANSDGGRSEARESATGDAATDVKGTLSAAAGNIRDSAVGAGERIRETVLEEGGEAIQRGKEGIAGQIDTLVSAIEASAKELHGGESALAPAADSVADYLKSAAEHLHAQNPKALAEEVSGFARTHPLMFLLGSAAAGFALTRVGKAAHTTSKTSQESRQ